MHPITVKVIERMMSRFKESRTIYISDMESGLLFFKKQESIL